MQTFSCLSLKYLNNLWIIKRKSLIFFLFVLMVSNVTHTMSSLQVLIMYVYKGDEAQRPHVTLLERMSHVLTQWMENPEEMRRRVAERTRAEAQEGNGMFLKVTKVC